MIPVGRWRVLSVFLWAVVFGGCAASKANSAKETLSTYARAVQNNDADAVYDLLDKSARARVSREDVKRLLSEQREELLARSRSLQASSIDVRARFELAGGHEAIVEQANGQYVIGGQSAWFGGASTPEQAVAALRQALQVSNLESVIRMLSPRTRRIVEAELRELERGLAEPRALDIRVMGERATVSLPQGHRLKLQRVEGIWYVDDLE